LTKRAGGGAREEREGHRERRAALRESKRRRAVRFLKIVRGAVRWLPMSVACAAGEVLGRLVYMGAGRWRRQTDAHLAASLPELSPAERRRIGRRSFALLGRGGFAFFVAHRQGAERTLARLTTEGLENLDAALAEKKGVLLVSFHYGCFEFLGCGIGTRYGARAVGAPSDDTGPTSVLIEMRKDLGCDTIQRGDPLEIIRTLKAGKPVSLLIDQDTSDVHGGFVPFFGQLAHTPLGPAALAVKMGVPVVMGFITWEGLTRHRVTVLPALRPRTDLPAAEAALELTARMTKVGEDEVRKRPEHWVWVHRRWETRPEDHPDYAVFRGGA
jgi:KDO2-lipid IV(A) lauroyltransferase